MKLTPNRVAVYLTVVASLLTALAPTVADLDTTSTASLIAGLAGVVVVVVKWLTGWQQHETDSSWQDHSRFAQELNAND
jgi:hypothetical protein